MRIVCVYIYPGEGFINQAVKFLQTYHENLPGADHHTIIVCNGIRASDEVQFVFGSLPNCGFIEHDNSGQDCGAFQYAAKNIPADMMVFFGTHTYFKRPGWLKRMVDTFNQYGQMHLYGSTGNQGDARFNVYPHIRTTAFWCSPSIINECPLRVTHNGLRYLWEHGPDGLTSWVIKENRRAWIVAWDNVYPLHICDSIPEGFHRGNQTNVLVGDRLTAPPYWHCE